MPRQFNAYDHSTAIAESYVNGNISEAVDATLRFRKLESIAVALAVFERLRGSRIGGIHDANGYRIALESRIAR